jgi:FkbH-like protein
MLGDKQRDLDYSRIVAASKRIVSSPEKLTLKVALLSDAATQQFVPVLRALLDEAGFSAEIYEGPFDAIEVEVYNASSGLYAFNPDAVVVLNATQALRAAFTRRRGSAAEFLADSLSRTTRVWDAIQANCRAVVIQSTFALPVERFFGNFDLKVPDSFSSITHELNAGIVNAMRARNGVLLHDVEHVASWVGRSRFFDDRFWDMWKSFCSLDVLPAVAQNLVDVLMATRGRGVKCVVLDLDNTLWGGVIGDDGLNGILLNAHGDGEAWHRLQLFLRELRRRGILLTVCSKNDERNALSPFESHPEMILRREDITVFLANWKDKAENIRAIREVLKIGFDSMVFLDDNPFERNLVRSLIPGIIVPELPEDPSDYVRFLSELNLFETAAFTVEDVKRAEMYKAEEGRRAEAQSYSSVEEFLQSLDMRIVVARFDSYNLPRIAQLIQRSNQFNLTTQRRSQAECERLMQDSSVVPLYVELSDRLGDHGLISVVILQPKSDELGITDWLMSCRVLERGVEQYVMNEVFALAREKGLAKVTGSYIPTAKNGMVKEFYARFGFFVVAEENSTTRWSLSTDAYQPIRVFIQPAGREAASTV